MAVYRGTQLQLQLYPQTLQTLHTYIQLLLPTVAPSTQYEDNLSHHLFIISSSSHRHLIGCLKVYSKFCIFAATCNLVAQEHERKSEFFRTCI